MKEALAALANWAENRNLSGTIVIAVGHQMYDEMSKEVADVLVKVDPDASANGIRLNTSSVVIEVLRVS